MPAALARQTQPPKNAPPPPARKNTLDELHARLAELADQARVVENTADGEGRSLTEDELKELKELNASFKATEEEIAAREANAAMLNRVATPERRVTQPEDLENSEPVIPSRRQRIEVSPGATRGNWGFRSMGEWAIQAKKAYDGVEQDKRIYNAPSTYGAEGTNTDGGFALPPDFRDQIMKIVLGEESVLSRCDQQVTSSNQITLPLDSTTPWQTSGGVNGGWTAEGNDLALSKPSLQQLNCKAHKLTALVPLTDELLEDVPSMTKWLQTKVPEKFNSLINTALISGTGAGQPQGLLNAPAKIVQTAETGQGAGTVVAKNILKMWGRLYAPLRFGAVWIINQDVEQQLQQLVMPGTNPSQPAYMPPGGFSQAPYATLLGRPILEVEACSALGTEGDIILTNLTQYLAVLKAGGMRTDVSIHLYFNSDHTAFRFIMRVGGQSYWTQAITRQNGGNTLSSIVTLNSTRT